MHNKIGHLWKLISDGLASFGYVGSMWGGRTIIFKQINIFHCINNDSHNDINECISFFVDLRHYYAHVSGIR